MSDATSHHLEQLSDAFADLAETIGASTVRVESGGAASSGFFWKPDLVVTAEEALAEDGAVSIVLGDGERRTATLVGRDASTDIALLRVDGAPGIAAPLAPQVPRAGALVLAVGGDRRALLGMVSVSGDAWHSVRGGKIDARIELDLALRRQDEGALVVDGAGRGLGMAVFGPRRRMLVIPSTTIDRIAARLERDGRVPRGYIGLGLQPVRAEADGVPAAIVLSTDPDGPSAAAGLHQGDVLVGWNGGPLRNLVQLLRTLDPDSVGQPLDLAVRRGPEELSLSLTIGERPPE
jgi:S1-C subfamily serine protease